MKFTPSAAVLKNRINMGGEFFSVADDRCRYSTCKLNMGAVEENVERILLKYSFFSAHAFDFFAEISRIFISSPPLAKREEGERGGGWIVQKNARKRTKLSGTKSIASENKISKF